MNNDKSQNSQQQNPGDIDNLLRVISHQLKSPVNAIETMLNVVLEGFTGDVDSQTAHYIRKAVAKAAEARQMVADLLSYEQYSGGQEQRFEPVDFSALLSSQASRYVVPAAEKKISLVTRFDAPVNVIVNGMKSGLETAVGNIIENAIKYTGEQGTVTVSLNIDEKDKMCAVSVGDTGCGIPAEDLSRLFVPFFRSAASRGGVPGTGLGLAIVKRVVDRHGGTISVSSEDKKGTVVTITIPYAELRAERAKQDNRRRVVIVGGVTAGPKAAARLRRLDESADITIIEKSALLSYAGCGIPSYIRGTVKSPKALMSTADNTLRDVHFFETIKNIRVFNRTEAVAIDRTGKEILLRDLPSGSERKIPYDVLVLATGAQSVVPRLKGIDFSGVYSLYNIEDAETIKRRFAEKPASDVCILGGGLVGIETAESLLMAGGRVTVLEKDAQILKLFDPDIAVKIGQALSHKGVKVITGVTVREIAAADGRYAICTDRGEFPADLIILSAGVVPNVSLARDAGLAIGASGGIRVNEFLQTSDPDIYAIGDCAESRHLVSGRETYLPLGSISTKMGRIAADNICGRPSRFPGSIGTTMFKIFDLQVARTGLETKAAAAAGFDAVSVVVSGLDRAHYEEGARYMVLKVIADRTTQKLLGAQGYGKGDLASRIGSLAAAISRGCTLEEVFGLDLGYYPAFNNPIDVGQAACLVLKNKIEGICETVNGDEFERIKNTVTVVDVSPHQEHEFGAIPGSINVPIENLRQEGIPIEKGERVVLYSKTSSRAYEAYRYLRANGWSNCALLEGGYIFWKM